MTLESFSGRLIAVILMIVGIGFVGMLTGTIATYFLNMKKIPTNDLDRKTMIDLSNLEATKTEQILDYVDYIRNKE